MKTLFVLFSAFVMVQPTNGQETVPLEEAQKAARKVTEAAVGDAPLKVDVDVDKPSAIEGDKHGLLVIPDKGVTAEKLTASADTIVPVGQLWALRVSLAVNGKAIGPDKLRMVTVTEGDKQRELELYFLGAGKNARGELELIVFGKDKESLLRVPLVKSSASAAQKLPIELSGRKNDEDSGTLTLHLVDQYTADLSVVRCVRE